MEKYDTSKALEVLAKQDDRVKGLVARIENAELATPVLEKLADAFNEKKNAEEQFSAVCIGITAIDALRTIDIKELEAVTSYTALGLSYWRA
jgi:hypothetical protein